MQSPGNSNDDTSWGGVAEWYADHLTHEDTYHAKVIIPHLMRALAPRQGQWILDLACGEGMIAREIASRGARVDGADIAKELIEIAKQKGVSETYYCAPADSLSFAKDNSYDAIVCVLALQNIENISAVFAECARVLKKEGRLLFVINHPAFRIPKRSSWGFDDSSNIQYRRVDGYMSASKESLLAHPGKKHSTHTVSFHRPLQEWVKGLRKSGFAITACEEWISHKKSEPGPRAAAEDTARKEFPLFMFVEAKAL